MDNFTLLLTYSGQGMVLSHVLLTSSGQEWTISTLLLTSSGREWQFLIATDIY